MFRRKDEEVAQDLLGDADSAMNASTAPATTTGYEESPQEATEPSSANGAAGAPSYSAARSAATNNFRQPIDYGRNRMQDFRNPLKNNATANASAADKSKGSSRRVLTVGNDILLKGEIATCDRLVIEGAVDATLNEVHTVEIAESGSFKGAAQIEDAEISGLFEGELVVRNRLVIYSTGRVRGKITYGEIEIERGGELSGEIRSTATAGEGKSAGKNGGKAKGEDSYAA
jgi:cytoskeletal protein CcmA (bactofilin family)